MQKRMISLFLCAAMVFSMLPTHAFASETEMVEELVEELVEESAAEEELVEESVDDPVADEDSVDPESCGEESSDASDDEIPDDNNTPEESFIVECEELHWEGTLANGSTYYENEPNNNIYEADAIEPGIDGFGSVTGTDMDYFGFYSDGKNEFSGIMVAKSPYLKLSLWDASGNVIVADIDGTLNDYGNYTYLIRATLNRGDYFLQVSSPYGFESVYGLGITLEPAGVISQSQFDMYLANAMSTGTLVLNERVTLTKDVTIPENVFFVIDGNGAITVPYGVSLTVCGGGFVYGSLEVEWGGTLELMNSNFWAFGNVDIEGDYIRNDWACLLCDVTDGRMSGNVYGVDKEDLAVYIRVQDDYHWEENLDYFCDSDYLFTSLGIQGNVTLPRDVTAGSNSHIAVEGNMGSCLTIPNGVTLTTGGDLSVYEGQTLINNGTIEIGDTGNFSVYPNATMTNYGSIINQFRVHIPGTLTNNGTIENCINGEILVYKDAECNGSLVNMGSIINNWDIFVGGSLYNYSTIDMMASENPEYYTLLMIEDGGSAVNYGTVNCYGNGLVDIADTGVWTGFEPIYHVSPFSIFKEQVDAAAASSEFTTIEVTGTIVLESDITLPENVYLSLDGGSITVPFGKKLTLSGGASINEGGKLNVEFGGSLELNECIYVNWKGSLVNYGTATFGVNDYGQKALVYNYVDSSGDIIGISHADQVLSMRVDNFEFPGWANYKYNFENNDYAQVELEIWGYDKAILMDDLTVPENGMLIINPSWNDIENGTHNDWVIINSDVDVYGLMWINARYNGTPCNLEINGNVTVHDGAVLNISGNTYNNGQVFACKGSIVNDYAEDFGASWSGNSIRYEGVLTQDQFIQEMEGNNAYELKDELVLEQSLTLECQELTIGKDGKLTIPEDVILTVPVDADITNNGDLTVEGVLNIWGNLTNSGNLEFHNNGTIKLAMGATVRNITASEAAKIQPVEGCVLKEMNGTYTAVKATPASVDGQIYDTLDEAIAAAEGEIIDLLADIGSVTISQTATINTNGWNAEITAGEGFKLRVAGGICYIYSDKLIDFAGSNVVLKSMLLMNFAIAKKDLDGSDYYAEIRRTYGDGKADKVTTIPYVQWVPNGTSYLTFSYNEIAAKEMSDELYVTIFKGDAEQGDGIPVSFEWVDSIQLYTERTLMKNQSDEDFVRLLVDMLNYGAFAQDQFDDYNITDLANANIGDYQKYASGAPYLENKRTSWGDYLGTSLVLKTNITMSFAFKNIGTDTSALITYTNHYGEKVEKVIPGSEYELNSGAYVIKVTDLAVADGRTLVNCKIIKDGNAIAEVIDSMESYAARTPSVPVATELMKFADSSYNHFH